MDTFMRTQETWEGSAFDSQISTPKAMPRWKRKQLEAASANASTASQPSTPQRRMRTSTTAPSPSGDRFIPPRTGLSKENFTAPPEPSAEEALMMASPAKDTYNRHLKKELLGDDAGSKVLSYTRKAPSAPMLYQNRMNVLYSQNQTQGSGRRRNTRHIPQAPERVLDAPDLGDDYYLNLISWSETNLLAVALGTTTYLWNAGNGSITELYNSEDVLTSVSFDDSGRYISLGENNGLVRIFDVESERQIRTLHGHQARVGSASWTGHRLATGSRDSNVHVHDVRIRDHLTAQLSGHSQEVCGLRWSPDGSALASGGNDNKLFVWDGDAESGDAPRFELDGHQAAVKAVAWCPWQDNLLASGGGTADRCIKFWNTQTGNCLNSIDTKSQVCAIEWCKHRKELVSSHGYSQNQLIVWKYPSMVKIAELTGHSSRVLHLATSPDGETVVSGSGDETLRFWKCFARDANTRASGAAAKAGAENIGSIRTSIR